MRSIKDICQRVEPDNSHAAKPQVDQSDKRPHGRAIHRGAGKCVITFADGSALTIKSAAAPSDLSGSVIAVFEGGDLELLFDNGS